MHRHDCTLTSESEQSSRQIPKNSCSFVVPAGRQIRARLPPLESARNCLELGSLTRLTVLVAPLGPSCRCALQPKTGGTYELNTCSRDCRPRTPFHCPTEGALRRSLRRSNACQPQDLAGQAHCLA